MKALVMKAWLLTQTTDLTRDTQPLVVAEVPAPRPGRGEVLIAVLCCGICHTELDEIEGRTPPDHFPMIPGHQVVGVVEENGAGTSRFRKGDIVGVSWVYEACGECEFCLSDQENLCATFTATGRDRNGGYAEYMVVREDFAIPIPKNFSAVEAAPLLCAGAIGYRSLKLTNLKEGQRLGLSGFGASAHLVLKLVKHLHPTVDVFAFARSSHEQEFALQLGATWAGNFESTPPYPLHAIIDTTPAWSPIVTSLRCLQPGGRLVINAIRKEAVDKSSLLMLNYEEHLWMEKEIKSVANITRKDVSEFLQIASSVPIKPQVESYPFLKANEALLDLKNRHVKGAKVLLVKEQF